MRRHKHHFNHRCTRINTDRKAPNSDFRVRNFNRVHPYYYLSKFAHAAHIFLPPSFCLSVSSVFFSENSFGARKKHKPLRCGPADATRVFLSTVENEVHGDSCKIRVHRCPSVVKIIRLRVSALCSFVVLFRVRTSS